MGLFFKKNNRYIGRTEYDYADKSWALSVFVSAVCFVATIVFAILASVGYTHFVPGWVLSGLGCVVSWLYARKYNKITELFVRRQSELEAEAQERSKGYR